MSRTFSRVVALIMASVGVATAAPQTQPPSFVAATRTVAVYATVTNTQGRLVPDLSRVDFAIDDNGKRQTLILFAKSSTSTHGRASRFRVPCLAISPIASRRGTQHRRPHVSCSFSSNGDGDSSR